ncbi:MAG TPA: hypothetical protein VIE89_24070, partial [Candidatus Binatia bacterium]
MSTAEQWLSREDQQSRTGRLERLQWLAAELPQGDYLTLPGGMMAKFLFEETRYCFAYGQYLAVIMLGIAFIERTLAAEFYASGRNDLERSSIAELLTEARNEGWLTEMEYDAFDRARKIRNPVTHFRRPGHRENIEA